MALWRFSLAVTLAVATHGASAAACAAEDYDTHVSGEQQCLLMRRFGPPEPETMVVWLHGDVSSGGPANYHFAVAQEAATQLSSSNVLSVALVRPGYPDGTGESSSASLLNSGRSDHYTRENIGEVAAAIERLRTHFKPKIVVLVGHSGGAATAAVILGMKPRLVDVAVLVSCPCDLRAWRAGRREWSRSEDPIKWVTQVSKSTKIVALTGASDENTSPELARTYVEALRARGLEARFQALPGETHNSAFRSREVLNAVRQLMVPR